MSINGTALSGAKKTAGIAVTYRAGAGNMFSTCPTTCPLNPHKDSGTQRIDREYLDALLGAVPRHGEAFTYSHFPTRQWARAWFTHRDTGRPTTTINFSADSERSAAATVRKGIPCVVALPADKVRKSWRAHGTRFVRCPAEYVDGLTCADCGGGKPLCARPDRDYVIAFSAHGASKKRVGTGTGGCYAAGGNVALHWRSLAERKDQESDADTLREFVRTLPRGRILRHHVAGDIGKA